MKLSVIVPVYNVEEYLSQCLESLLSQDFKDYEIILVNDGSTDGSLQLCYKYSEVHSQILLVDKKNGGLSDARNAGIEKAEGEYITFIDSDDYIRSNNYFSTVVNYLNTHDVDVITMPFAYCYDNVLSENSKFFANRDLSALNIVNAYEFLIKSGSFLVSACTKFLKRVFLLENNLFFEKGLLSEDNEWFFRVLRASTTFGNIDESFYVYRQNRVGSITDSISIKNINALLYIVNKSIAYYVKNEKSVLKQYELSFCSYLWCICLAHSHNYKDKRLKQELKKISYILNFDLYPRVKYIKILYRFCGYKTTSFVLNKYLLSRDARNKKNKDMRC